jgi:hypothetical protein
MLLHKITYQVKMDIDTPVGIEEHIKDRTYWAGSKAEAATKRGNVRQINGYMPNSVQTAAIDVPTKKRGLLNFLNTEIAQ